MHVHVHVGCFASPLPIPPPTPLPPSTQTHTTPASQKKSVAFTDPNKSNLVAQVSTTEVKVYGQGKSPKIVAFDCGMKYNIVRYFVKHHGVQLTVVPYDYDLQVSVRFD